MEGSSGWVHFSAMQLRTVNRLLGIRISPFSKRFVPRDRYYTGLVTRFSPGSLAGTSIYSGHFYNMPRATDPRIARSLRVAATKTTARTNEAQKERATRTWSSLMHAVVNFKNNSQRPAQVSPIIDRSIDRSIAQEPSNNRLFNAQLNTRENNSSK